MKTKILCLSLVFFLIISYNSNSQPGACDLSFDPGTGANNYVYALAIQNNNKSLIGGILTSYNGTSMYGLLRINEDGSYDNTFNTGFFGNGDYVYAIAIQSDNKIVIGGNFTINNERQINCIARLNIDGSLDGTFNTGTGFNNTVETISIQNDGKIIIGGWFTAFNGIASNRIVRLNTDGSLDATFNPGTGANERVWTTAIQSDGKIIIGGVFTSYNGTSRGCIARLMSDGSLDLSFNPGSGANNPIIKTAIQGDGKILIGGNFGSFNGISINYLARLNANGSLDNSFNVGVGPNNIIYSLYAQNNEKIIIGGAFTKYNNISINGIARVNTDGSIDSDFNVGSGANGYVKAIAIQGDGKIMIVGEFSTYQGINRRRIARIIGDPVSISENIYQNILIYPNPSTNKITISNNENILKKSTVDIYNIQGVKVFSNTFNNQNLMEIDVTTFDQGVYIAKIMLNDGSIAQKKFIVIK